MTIQLPTKRILSSLQLTAFQSSNIHNTTASYIEELDNSVIGVELVDELSILLMHFCVLDEIEDVVKSALPVDNKASRFVHLMFRTFYDKAEDAGSNAGVDRYAIRLRTLEITSAYWHNAWGNRERIDYGSEMELNYVGCECERLTVQVDSYPFPVCLERVDVVSETITLRWRRTYIQGMRVLWSTCWLEPGGSHGVWSLDDYPILQFLFGSAQLGGMTVCVTVWTFRVTPQKAIHGNDVVDEVANGHMCFAYIKFISSVCGYTCVSTTCMVLTGVTDKTASLRLHLPMLDDIPAVKTWEQVNARVIKVYKAKALGKLPDIQHLRFGSILLYEGPPPPSETGDKNTHHRHVHEGRGDCCWIPILSASAAGRESEPGKMIKGPGIRAVPSE
ncbi:Phosphotyrosyl phosphatase activator [Pisolithus tinctorius]|uniref:Serine/threonine-protein phosphatase 2A activator n=1 Tax=Pisolithus tinctorius Marx 270 TaxID=870435 RepID=A0A0C3KM20_PISTI|nr:Phosphotyrosyl phosphatase activator [Pisolithus tinctorius]KIO10657.1 hypothetical protein M404DRAFT_129018 [Pisolithus tinctorius Marx 270]